MLDAWALKVLQFNPVVLFSVSLWLRSIILSPFALKDFSSTVKQWTANKKHIIAVGILSPVAYLMTLYAITMAPLSYVAPARELSMLVGAVLATQLLGEKNATERLVGTCFIAAGVLIIGLL